jgi:hypothetical protein
MPIESRLFLSNEKAQFSTDLALHYQYALRWYSRAWHFVGSPVNSNAADDSGAAVTRSKMACRPSETRRVECSLNCGIDFCLHGLS